MAKRPTRRQQAVAFAAPEEVAEFAHSLSEKYLQCRELGHLWRPWKARWSTHENCFERVLRCTRCRTAREQKLSDRGAILTNQYAYPDGYLHAGFGRIAGDGRDALRLESLSRLVSKNDNT